jgi:hypothetical protein
MKENQWHPQSRVSRAKEVMFSQLDDELLAIDSQAGFCYSLNETAGLIWEMMAEPITLKEICTRLQEKFDVDEKDCLSDVTALLQGLYQAELVKVSHEDKS